jgi:hypothetical protein
MKTIPFEYWSQANFRISIKRANGPMRLNRRSLIRPSILTTQHREACDNSAGTAIRRRRWPATTSNPRNTDGLLFASHELS